jgi:hypothetical protein
MTVLREAEITKLLPRQWQRDQMTQAEERETERQIFLHTDNIIITVLDDETIMGVTDPPNAAI